MNRVQGAIFPFLLMPLIVNGCTREPPRNAIVFANFGLGLFAVTDSMKAFNLNYSSEFISHLPSSARKLSCNNIYCTQHRSTVGVKNVAPCELSSNGGSWLHRVAIKLYTALNNY